MYLNRFRRWLGRDLSHTERLLVNALEAQRTLVGYVRFHISDSGTRGPVIRRTLSLYMRYITEAVYPDTRCAVFARTLAEANAAAIPGAILGSAFAPDRLRGRPFCHALVLDASAYPCHATGAIRPDAFYGIFRCVVSQVPLAGSVVIVHGDAFVRGHSFFKYEFYRTVKPGPQRFVAVAASPPPPPSVRRLALRTRLQSLRPQEPARHPWDWSEKEHRQFFSRYCRRDLSWPQYLDQVQEMKSLHEEEMRQRRQVLAIRRQITRECFRWESVPKDIPTLEDLESQPPLLCMLVRGEVAAPRRRSRRKVRFIPLDSDGLRRLCLGASATGSSIPDTGFRPLFTFTSFPKKNPFQSFLQPLSLSPPG